MKSTFTFLQGAKALDETIIVLLKTGMFVAGALAFVLDNTLPGIHHSIRLDERVFDGWLNVVLLSDIQGH